ncbi:MAG TPA: phosphatase PAP2 family protein [Gammaproteobacteria bacterium]|nr:phosphatase PAP2 family protein [Gammaproteobacteria bacterium]
MLVACIATLLIAALLWRIVQQAGPALWRSAARLWDFLSRSALADRARQVPLLRGAFARTLNVWRYLGMHALVSFVIALAAFVVFAEIADSIGAGEALAAFDKQLAASLRAHVGYGTLQAFAVITRLGNPPLLIGIGIAVALYLAWRKWWIEAAIWVLVTGLGGLLIAVLKAYFERTRPIHDQALIKAAGWSFPSGHASGAMFVYGMLGYFAIRHAPRAWHIPIALAAIVTIVFVGFSRVILQVHYLSDVLGGFAAAGAWLALCVAALEAIRRRRA